MKKVKNMNTNKDELTKKIIAEKDKAKLKYDQRINDIQQHYGINFNLEHTKNSSIKNITFTNLKYKSTFINLSLTYDFETRSFDSMNYEYIESRNVKSVNHKKMVAIIDKENKLKLLIAEVEKANNEYVNEINDIDKIFKKAPINNEKVLLLKKDSETE